MPTESTNPLESSTPTGSNAVTPANLTRAYAAAGLIQFGRFEQPDGSFWPLMINLRWLPSYPALLRETAAALAPVFEPFMMLHEAIRLLTTVDALPIGVALSLRVNVPLVYPYGTVRDYTAAFAIEGAYDVGHPTVLLSDVLIDAAQANAITAVARRVGLNVGAILAVIDLGLGARAALEAAGYSVQTVTTLRAMLPILAAHDAPTLPPVMRVTVEEWLANQGAR
jgi:orotate phosphoribosyltransferase